MNIIDLQESLKDYSDNNLLKEYNQPINDIPQYLILTELQRRKRMRDDYKRQEASNTSTVAEEMITGVGVPQEGLMTLASALTPNTALSQDTGIDQATPMQATRAPQPQMAADGGTLKMAEGGITALLDGVFGFGRGKEDIGKPVQPYPDNSPNPRDRSTWMRMYGETHNLDGSPKTMSPNISEINKPTDYKSPFVSDVSADIGDFTPNPISSEMDQLVNQGKSPNLNNISRVGSLPFLPPVTDNSFSELPIRGADTDPAQQLAKFLASRRSDLPGVNLPGESDPYIIDPDAASEAGQAILDSELKDPSSPTNPTIGSYGRTTVGQTKDEIKRMNEILDTAGIGPDTATGGVDMLDLMLQAQTERGGYEAADQYSKDELMQYLTNQKPRFQGGAVPGGSFPTGAMYNPTASGAFPNDAELAGQYPSSSTLSGDNFSNDPTKGYSYPTDVPADDPSMEGKTVLGRLAEVQGGSLSEDIYGGYTDPEAVARRQQLERMLRLEPLGEGMQEDVATTIAEAANQKAAEEQESKTAEEALQNQEDSFDQPNPIAILDSVTDGGAGGAGFGSAESEISKLLADRRKRADQNKWLALAEAGFAMMGPAATFGEGIGKGGKAGLASLRESQKGMDAFETDMLKLQASMNIADARNQTTLDAANIRSDATLKAALARLKGSAKNAPVGLVTAAASQVDDARTALQFARTDPEKLLAKNALDKAQATFEEIFNRVASQFPATSDMSTTTLSGRTQVG